MDVADQLNTTVTAPLKERFKMTFGENGNDRLRYLVMRGSFPDSRVVVRHEDIIADLMMLQPKNIPYRYRWTRASFVTVEEIISDLRRRPHLQIKPEYQVLLFDATAIYRQLSGPELSQWMELMCDASQSKLIELF